MTRPAPSLTLAVPRSQGFTAFSASALLHTLALGTMLAVTFGASGTLPEPAGTVGTFNLPLPELAPPPPPPEAPPQGVRRLPSVAPPPAVEGHLTVPPVVPDGLPEPEAPDFVGSAVVCKGVCAVGGDPTGSGNGEIVGGIDRVAAAIVATPPPPRRVSEGVQGPRRVHYVAPVYPPIAIATHVEGKVVLDCLITEEGRIAGVTVLEGNPLLTSAAAEAVQQWIYTPTLLSGVRSAVIMKVTVNFTLRR